MMPDPAAAICESRSAVMAFLSRGCLQRLLDAIAPGEDGQLDWQPIRHLQPNAAASRHPG